LPNEIERPVVLQERAGRQEAHVVLVPLTDTTNPYTVLMLELIANDRRYPVSKYPRERNVAVRTASAAASRGRRLALIAAALVGVAAIAFVTGLI
jgi:hypothetical protein